MQQAFDAMTPRQVDPPETAAVPVRQPRAATEILETAASLIASSGMRTSLKEIADACGILPGSLYHHFDSKEAILVELIEQYRADLDGLAVQVQRSPARRCPDRPIDEQIVTLAAGDGSLRTPSPGRVCCSRSTNHRRARARRWCASPRQHRRPRSRPRRSNVFRAGSGPWRPPGRHRPRDVRRSLLPGHAPHQPRRDRRRPGRRPACRRSGAASSSTASPTGRPDRRAARSIGRDEGRPADDRLVGRRRPDRRTSGSPCCDPSRGRSSGARATKPRRCGTSRRRRVSAPAACIAWWARRTSSCRRSCSRSSTGSARRGGTC